MINKGVFEAQGHEWWWRVTQDDGNSGQRFHPRLSLLAQWVPGSSRSSSSHSFHRGEFCGTEKRVFPEGTFLTDEKFCGQTMAPFLCSGIIQVQVWRLFSSGMNPRNFTTPNVECDRRILYANKTILIHIFMQLCEWAQNWANHLASTNEFYYRSDKNLGQNLFCCPISALVTDLTGQEVASYWYSTVRRYNYFKEPRLLHTNVNAGKCYSN